MKKYRNFIIRVADLLLLLGVLWQYQSIALVRAQAVAQRQQEIQEVEAWNASVRQAEQEAEADTGLHDGVYEGTGLGFGDDITVQITVQDGRMTEITVLYADGEDRPYYKQALTMLDPMLAAQSGEVDLVTGATLTCEGLRDAVQDALGKAGA